MQNDTTKNPAPAPGQVWRWREGGDPVITIKRIDDRGMIYGTGRAFMDPAWLLGHYECIGIETPAGRVMVGERRALGGGVFINKRILDDGSFVQVDERTGVEQEWKPHATEIATWPLAAESAPADPCRQPYKPEKPIPPQPKGPVPKPANVPERRAYATADDPRQTATWDINFAMAPGMAEDEVREMVRRVMADADLVIEQSLLPGPRMPMPEATAAAQNACGCALCKSRTRQTADVQKMIAEWYAKPMSQKDTDALAERLHVKMNPRPSAPVLSIPFAIDPRAAREQRRREIDAVLREDARRFPAFATARRAAVMAAEEGHRPHLDRLPAYLDGLRAYESAIAKGMRPARAKQEIPGVNEWVEWGWCAVGFAAYERARAMP
jgi:hypothetical protein